MPQIPDDPSVKVFSKKKAADRMQHSLRSFSVPLRPTSAAAATTTVATTTNTTTTDSPKNAAESLPPAPAAVDSGQGVTGAGGGGGGGTPTKITVPANLPASAAEVVERVTRSLTAFKEACIILPLILVTTYLLLAACCADMAAVCVGEVQISGRPIQYAGCGSCRVCVKRLSLAVVPIGMTWQGHT